MADNVSDNHGSCADKGEGSLYIPTFFARQPIFDAKPTVIGYELLYRENAEATCAEFADADNATLSVAANATMHPRLGRLEKTSIMVNFTRESILDGMAYALPCEVAVVKVTEPDEPDEELYAALRDLKGNGYSLALDDFTDNPELHKLYELADTIVIDGLNAPAEKLAKQVTQAKAHGCRTLAKRLEDTASFETAARLKFDYFQGFFFQTPELVPGRKLTSNEISKLNLFRVLEKEEPDFDELAQTIQTDVSISYRLLSYLNSAAFSFPRKITSIKQAVVILGWTKVKNWLRLIILTDVVPPNKTSELPYLSAVRGKFLESAAMSHEKFAPRANSLFLLGLFSLLDAMLDMPMEEICNNLPLEQELSRALCREKNETYLWLDMAQCFETGDWNTLDELMRSLGLDTFAVARCYYDSLLWANSFFGYE